MSSLLLFFSLLQSNSPLLRSDKVYSILAVLLVIFVAILVYLFSTNRKLKRLENQFEEIKAKQAK
jgi:CcmD family protein